MTARALIVAAALASPAVLVQHAAPASLSVAVSDLYGWPLDATVVLRNNRTGERLEVTTGAARAPRTLSIAPGTYTGIASAHGYAPLIHFEICVVEGRPARFSPVLGPARFDDPTLEALERMRPSRRHASSGPPSVQTAGVMSDADIRAAMAFGSRSPRIEPYELKDGRRVIGRLFTPFWRVAALAHQAAAANQPFTPDEIPRAFIEDLVWIVAERETVRKGFFAAVSAIELRGSAKGTVVPPVWTLELSNECDVTTMEALFGPHFTTMAKISAFERAGFRAGHEIGILYGPSALPATGLGFERKATRQRVVVTDRQLADWK